MTGPSYIGYQVTLGVGLILQWYTQFCVPGREGEVGVSQGGRERWEGGREGGRGGYVPGREGDIGGGGGKVWSSQGDSPVVTVCLQCAS